MSWKNQTTVTEFWLLGFQNIDNIKIPLFIIFLAIYISILTGNLLIIALVLLSHSMMSPMYFFLANLSWTDLLLTTITIPTMLYGVLHNGEAITFSECISQLYLFCSSAGAEVLLLTVMSYDRYLAICNPLRYLLIMDYKLRVVLVICSWVFGLLLTLIVVSQLLQLRFCGPNVIDHFFCDPIPLRALACSSTFTVELLNLILGLPATLLPFGCIVFTYIYIIIAILKIKSSTGRQKAFSTCSSHLTTVCIYYGALFTLYVIPSKVFVVDLTKIQSLLYTVVIPLLNPIIYSLRNNEILTAIKKLIHISKWCRKI